MHGGGDDGRRRSIITGVATTASRRWRVTLAVMALVVAAGVWAFTVGLDREGFPPVDTPISVVTGTYFVDDAERVDSEVAQPLAEAFRGVDDVIETTSRARPTSFVVTVEFGGGVDSEEGTARLRELDVPVPDGAAVEYRPVNAAKFVGRYDVLVSIVGPAGAGPADFQEQADLLADHLDDAPAIEAAEVRDLLTDDPAGGGEGPGQRLTRFTRVALGPAGYEPAVTIGLRRAGSSDLDVLEFSDLVEDRLSAADQPLADGYTAEITADLASSVRSQLSSLSSNLLTGLVAVAVVSLVLIGWRVAATTAGFMVLVVVGALVGLWVVGFTLNTITLFGLILTLGLLVDDAIVISESIDANRDEADDDESSEEVGVVRTAIDRVGSASFAGTLTTVVVFSPMLFVGGVLGEFVRPIPATVIVTLLLSFAFSIAFIPTVARLFILKGGTYRNPVVRGEQAAARAVGRLAGYPSGHGWSGRIVGLALVLVAVAAIGAGVTIARSLGFSIFPTGKDSTGLSVSAEFPAGTTIEEAQQRSARIDEAVVEVLGDELERSQYLRGNERVVETVVDLTPIDARSTTAPTFVERIEGRVSDIDGVRVTVNQAENGPPAVDFPFATQIAVDDGSVEVGQELAAEIRNDLLGREFDSGSTTATVVDAIVSTDGEVARTDGQRIIEVRAKYDEDSSLTGVLNATEDHVTGRHPPEELLDRGLAADALGFDFGAESENQEDFAALGVAGVVALGLMLVLISLQFRSLAQSLLIFLAIPFSFLGVFAALALTDNPLSFLAVVGFIALVGVAVNNTILLVDAANQERRAGATAADAIAAATTSRFRPLVATTVTTVAGLLPLSLRDPFWESLGFTLMGGLVSSTLLVLLAFPAFYLGLEAVRTPARNWVRARRGRPLVT